MYLCILNLMNMINIGDRFGKLTILESKRTRIKNSYYYKVKCDCGKEYIVTHYNKSHSFSEHDIDSITNQYELFEIKAGFKNYTALDSQLNPICPHCKQKI